MKAMLSVKKTFGLSGTNELTGHTPFNEFLELLCE